MGLVERIADFQKRKFPNVTVAAKLLHAQKEITEVINDPNDLVEWADVLILFLAAAHQQGLTLPQLVAAAYVKMDENERRKWAAPDADGCVHHIKEETRP